MRFQDPFTSQAAPLHLIILLDSSSCFKSAKSLRLARRIAIDINGVIHAAKPDGRPRFRSRMRVASLSIDSHVYIVSIGNGPSAVRITRRPPGTNSTIS
jgi:hypothetical protein